MNGTLAVKGTGLPPCAGVNSRRISSAGPGGVRWWLRVIPGRVSGRCARLAVPVAGPVQGRAQDWVRDRGLDPSVCADREVNFRGVP